MYRFLHKQSASSNAILSLVEENSTAAESHSFVKVTVTENDQRRLASKLKRNFFQVGFGTAEIHDKISQ